MTEYSNLKTELIGNAGPLIDGPVLSLYRFRIGLRSNSQALLDRLAEYFSPVIDHVPADLQVTMIERDTIDSSGLPFNDWKREPGKTGRKDAYFDLNEARVIHKVRTGMVFYQSPEEPLAIGPCLVNDNQVINFINAQYMNNLQQNGALILHASGLVYNGKAMGIAGFSGGGKSTLMLHMLGQDDMDYLTNDRLFIHNDAGCTLALGIPKLPRINPGTIINNDNLLPMLSEPRVHELRQMNKQDLWELEEKYDVDLKTSFNKDDIVPSAPLSHFLILNWKRESDQSCSINEVNLEERPDLLPAIMKSPGPFYQDSEGVFFRDDMALDPADYISAMKGVKVYEASGRIDFSYAASIMLRVMGGGLSE